MMLSANEKVAVKTQENSKYVVKFLVHSRQLRTFLVKHLDDRHLTEGQLPDLFVQNVEMIGSTTFTCTVVAGLAFNVFGSFDNDKIFLHIVGEVVEIAQNNDDAESELAENINDFLVEHSEYGHRFLTDTEQAGDVRDFFEDMVDMQRDIDKLTAYLEHFGYSVEDLLREQVQEECRNGSSADMLEIMEKEERMNISEIFHAIIIDGKSNWIDTVYSWCKEWGVVIPEDIERFIRKEEDGYVRYDF